MKTIFKADIADALNTVGYMIDCLDADGELLGFFCYARNENSYIHCDYDDWEKDICLAINGEINKELWEMEE